MKHLTKKLGLAVTAFGCAAPSRGCAVVDPVPPPLKCELLSAKDLQADGWIDKQPNLWTLRIRLTLPRFDSDPVYLAVEVSDLTGEIAGRTATVEYDDYGADGAEPVIVIPIPMGPLPSNGTLKVRAVVDNEGRTSCPLERVLTLSIAQDQVLVTSADQLPLRERHSARIRVAERTDEALILEARTRHPGPCRFGWSATGGCIEAAEGPLVIWRLPREPGLHQAQLIADFGEQGLAFDTLTVEV